MGRRQYPGRFRRRRAGGRRPAAQLDTNGNNVTFASPSSGNGGLTKYGAGTLTLTVSNSYAGRTAVNGGTLLATTTAALPGYLAPPGNISVNGAGSTLAVEAGRQCRAEFQSSDLDALLGLAFSGHRELRRRHEPRHPGRLAADLHLRQPPSAASKAL